MSVSVTCPFCRSVFSIAEVPAARRTPCPNCGESVTVSADAPTTDGPPTSTVSETPPPTVRTSGLVFLSLGLTTLAVAGFLVWWFFGPTPPTPSSGPDSPVVTTPRTVSGLKYIAKDSQVILAVQPAALEQHATSKNRSAEQLLTQFGVPEEMLKQLRDAGLPPKAIRSLLIAVADLDQLIPRLVIVLTLREPLGDEAKFRDKFKAQGRDPVKVELAGLPLVMNEVNEKTFLFALNEKDLATAKAPTGGYDDLRPAVRESVDKLNISSVAWMATDSRDWAKLPLLKLAPGAGLPAEVSKRLDGVRAAAVGVSLEPDLYLRVSVRVNDSAVARDTADAMRPKLNDLNAYVTPSGEWADALLPLEPLDEVLPKLKAVLKK